MRLGQINAVNRPKPSETGARIFSRLEERYADQTRHAEKQTP